MADLLRRRLLLGQEKGGPSSRSITKNYHCQLSWQSGIAPISQMGGGRGMERQRTPALKLHTWNNGYFIYFILLLFRAVPATYGDSQARRLIRDVPAGLHHSHTNSGSEPHLQPTPELTATPDP